MDRGNGRPDPEWRKIRRNAARWPTLKCNTGEKTERCWVGQCNVSRGGDVRHVQGRCTEECWLAKNPHFSGMVVLIHQDDDRTSQNLSIRRAFSIVILANWPLALANPWGPAEPVAKRLSRTACTVSQSRPAALQGMRTPSS
jgi:hypothetical protein